MPAALAIPALIGAGASVGSAVINAKTASGVAKNQANAAQQAAGLQQNAANQNIGNLTSAQQAAQGSYAPYTGLWTQAAGLLGGLAGQAPASFTAPTMADAANDPGYQFRVQQGQQALQRSAASHGTLLTGGTAKGLLDYGQNAASQEYGNLYGRRFGEYQQGLLNNQNQFNNLSGLLNFGYGAQSGQNVLNQNYAGMIANQRMAGAGYGAQGVTDTANALGAGQIGQANAYGGALSGISGNLQQLLMLQQFLKSQNAPKVANTSLIGG